MATINYTKTAIDNKSFVVEWPSLASGDEGQPFEAAGAELLSVVAVNAVGNLHVSNESGAPSVGGSVGIAMGGIFKPSLPARWYFPRSQGVTAGTINALFREV